jgi:hypothetical protein
MNYNYINCISCPFSLACLSPIPDSLKCSLAFRRRGFGRRDFRRFPPKSLPAVRFPPNKKRRRKHRYYARSERLPKLRIIPLLPLFPKIGTALTSSFYLLLQSPAIDFSMIARSQNWWHFQISKDCRSCILRIIE